MGWRGYKNCYRMESVWTYQMRYMCMIRTDSWFTELVLLWFAMVINVSIASRMDQQLFRMPARRDKLNF